MKTKRLLCSAAAIILTLSGCGNKALTKEESLTVYAMDTVMELKACGDEDAAKAALRAAEREILRLDALFRRDSEDSDIYKINHGTAQASADTAEIVRRAAEISASTDGAFDVTIAPVMDLWGFYGGNFRVPTDSEIVAALERVGYKNISVGGEAVTLSGGAQLDLGGIAKGFASEKIMKIFVENGISSALVSLGGNVRALGTKPNGEKWRIAVQNPDGGAYIGYLDISDLAVITSGGYQRCFERDGVVYHHIIDPATGYPADSGVKSVTVIGSDGTLADGLSTALFVMGLDKGTEYWRTHDGFDVIFVTNENEIYVTEGAADIFESDSHYEILDKT